MPKIFPDKIFFRYFNNAQKCRAKSSKINRKLYYFLMFLALIFASMFILSKNNIKLVWQVTASMPKGLYLIHPNKSITRNSIVLFKPKLKILNFLLTRRWLPKDGVMMKYVFGLPGDFVCQHNKYIYINNKKIAKIYVTYDGQHKLPNTKFCGKLQHNQYLLMSTKTSHSFDGRYFGPVQSKDIIGSAIAVS